jgi:hypothetical protein
MASNERNNGKKLSFVFGPPGGIFLIPFYLQSESVVVHSAKRSSVTNRYKAVVALGKKTYKLNFKN